MSIPSECVYLWRRTFNFGVMTSIGTPKITESTDYRHVSRLRSIYRPRYQFDRPTDAVFEQGLDVELPVAQLLMLCCDGNAPLWFRRQDETVRFPYLFLLSLLIRCVYSAARHHRGLYILLEKSAVVSIESRTHVTCRQRSWRSKGQHAMVSLCIRFDEGWPDYTLLTLA
jgi:hypothetical protein